VPATNITYAANFGVAVTLTGTSSTNVGGAVTGSGTFVVGSTNQLTAVASNGWLFVSWSDGTTNNPDAIVVPATNITYTAIFQPVVYTWTNFVGDPGVTGTTDGTGSAAQFSLPAGVVVDNAGNVFVADYANHTIRKVTSAGVVTTLAGSAGVAGTTDATGSAARFNNPVGVAVDTNGNVYVADSNNHTIRKVTSAGVVTTLAGSAGVTGTNDATGSAARFNWPHGLALDNAGNVVVADYSNHTIRQVTMAGVVTTLAGSAGVTGTNDATGSAARFNSPTGVAVDSASNVYVADYANHIIRQLIPQATDGGTNWLVTTVAGRAGVTGTNDGAGSAAQFNDPAGVAVDRAGNVFVVDQHNHTIRQLSAVPARTKARRFVRAVTTIGGSPGNSGTSDGAGSAARFDDPFSVAVDSLGNVFVADQYNNRISTSKSLGVPPVTLTVLAGNGGNASGGGSYTSGSNAVLTATASNGWSFVSWSDGATNNPYTIAVPATNFTYTADFQRQTATITGGTNPENGGSVSGGGTYITGTNVQLTASVNSGWTFTGWSDGVMNTTRTVTVPTTNVTYTANFQQLTATITAQANPPAGGLVSGGGVINDGATATVIAVPNAGYQFINWTESGTPVSTAASYSFTVTANRNLTANFGNGLTITTSSLLPAGTNGISYRQLFQATGGYPAYTWAFSAGRLPPGLTLNASSGALSGKPTAAGVYNFRVNVTDSQHQSASNDFSVAIGNVAGPLAGTYTGLLLATNAPPCAGAGFVKIVLAKTGAFAGNLTLAGQKTAFTGRFDATGHATNTVAGVSVVLQTDMHNGSGQISGVITGSGFMAVLLAELPNTSPMWQGTYTVALSPADATATNVPQGYGYATLVVSRRGSGSLSGVLNDGTKVTTTAAVLRSGLWPVYVPLYQHAGVLAGWVTLATNTEVTGVLDWCAPARPSYAAFSTTLTLNGSQYTTGPAPLAGIWDVTVAGGGFSNLVKTVTIDANGDVTVINPGADDLTLKLLTTAKVYRIVFAGFQQQTTLTGQFTGSFKATVGGKAIVFNGLLLQAQRAGAGLFQNGTGLTGGVTIEPVP